VKYAWLAIGIFAARFLATAIAYPEVGGDLDWQRWLGALILRTHALPRTLGNETFTAAGAPWIPQEWAFSIGAALAGHGVGWFVFAGGTALAATAALALASLQAERLGASPRANLLCTCFAGIALFESFGVRAQVVVWPLLALFLLLIESETALAYGAIGVAAVWSNLHASAMLAPVVAALVAAGTLCDEGARSPNFRRRATIAVASAFAICCNPFGVRLPLYAFGLFSSPFKDAINEWRPSDLGDPSFAYGGLPLLLIALLYLAGPSPRRARDAIVLATFAFLLMSAGRNMALFGIVALPIAAAALSRRVAFFAPPARPAAESRVARFALPALGGLLAALVAIGLLQNKTRTEGGVPARAVAQGASLQGERRILCGDFAWCSSALRFSNARVFLDGRADPFPAGVWRDFLTVARVGPAWRETLAARRVNTVVTAKDSALDDALALAPGWSAAYTDRDYRVWQLKDLR
jgi:hypothetical protein